GDEIFAHDLLDVRPVKLFGGTRSHHLRDGSFRIAEIASGDEPKGKHGEGEGHAENSNDECVFHACLWWSRGRLHAKPVCRSVGKVSNDLRLISGRLEVDDVLGADPGRRTLSQILLRARGEYLCLSVLGCPVVPFSG